MINAFRVKFSGWFSLLGSRLNIILNDMPIRNMKEVWPSFAFERTSFSHVLKDKKATDYVCFCIFGVERPFQVFPFMPDFLRWAVVALGFSFLIVRMGLVVFSKIKGDC